jgi:hypothetical protein
MSGQCPGNVRVMSGQSPGDLSAIPGQGQIKKQRSKAGKEMFSYLFERAFSSYRLLKR